MSEVAFVGNGSLDVGTIVVTTNSDGYYGAQVDVFGEDGDPNLGGEDGLLHYGPGFMANPEDADDNGEATALYWRLGNDLHVLPGQDTRLLSYWVLPTLKKGASVHYGKRGKNKSFAHFEDDGTYTVYVPVAESGDTVLRAHAITVGKDGNGEEQINVQHSSGYRITLTPNGIGLVSKNGQVTLLLDDTAVNVNGNLKVQGNIGVGPLAQAWFAAVTAALTGLGASPGPPPVSLTA